MTMTQRYPDYFDGVVAGGPAMRTGYAEIGRAWTSVAFNQIATEESPPVFSDSDKKLVVNGVLNACDAKDGLKDGMVFNTRVQVRSFRSRLCGRQVRSLPVVATSGRD
jgi:feruloyl esterase